MNESDEFFDFTVFWEFFNPFDEGDEYKCSHCGRIIKGNEKVQWVDKKNKIFKCPGCDNEISVS
jgi:DNA-directed RNA polymerase subunit RPC12/RpoP